MMLLIKFLCRLIPAITFIFSGFVKAVDPTGSAVKFNDYFMAFHLEWLISLAMPLAIGLATIEFLLGFYLLLGLYLKRIIPAVLTFMGFFTILTLYIAIYNPVTDCGCFGDAIIITNWQTFWKNVIVVLFAYGAWVFRKSYREPATAGRRMTTALLLAIYIIGVSWYSLCNLPILDFRPFKTGAHVHSLMTIPEGAELPEYETIFILEKEGEQQRFTLEEYPYDDTTWVFIDSETHIIKEGYIPPLESFSLIDNEKGDITEDIIYHPGAVFLMISPELSEMAPGSIAPLSNLSKAATERDIPFYCVTASGTEETLRFENEHSSSFHYLFNDEITLKTIIRSNPGLVLIYDGVVIAKWHYSNLPDTKVMNNPLSMALSENHTRRNQLLIWAHVLGLILIPALLLTSITIKKRR